MPKPKIAVFSGPRSTVANTPSLVTSNKGRTETDAYVEGRFDHLVGQTLYEPVVVRIKKFIHLREVGAIENSHLLSQSLEMLAKGQLGAKSITVGIFMC